MNNENTQKDVKSFFKKASPDTDKEFLGQQDTGEYVDARNARPVSVDGTTGSLSKIKGEEVEYDNSNLTPNYILLGSMEVDGKKLELWASPNPSDPDSIRIDGEVMVQSDELLFDVDFPFQFDVNEGCKGGEVFLTDNKNVPIIFNVGDIIDSFNTGSDKYFDLFNRALYEINLSTPLNIPVFVGLEPVGGGAGLPVGEYSYSLRYVNDAGDRTNFSPTTPLIPVVQATGDASPQYPYTKTRGGDADITAKTSFGIKLRFRIVNLLNYDSIEVRRYEWNTGALNVAPTAVLIARIPIVDGQISVEEIVDPIDSNIEETLDDTEDTNQLMFVERAKAIRYYDKKLVLMNYSIASRTMTADFTQRLGDTVYPVIDKLGKPGYNDPYNHAYKKSYMGGEAYGFAIQGYDGVAGRGFALGIPGAESFEYPNRRDVISANTFDYSFEGAPTAANTVGNVSLVHESFDLSDAITKGDVDTFKNISSDGGKNKSSLQTDTSSDPENYGSDPNIFGKHIGPYSPYTPTGQNDSSTSGHNYRVNTWVERNGLGNADEVYNPRGFAPNYYARGMALNGLDNLPPWVKSISIARTKRADRVVAQGLGTYSLNEGDFNLIGNSALASKNRDRMWACFPDVDKGIIDPSILNDINTNPQNYKIQFVSPLGFFSELYNFEREDIAGRDRICDLMTYVRVLNDSGQINPTESGVGVSDYVAYNKYRNNNAANGGFFASGDGNKLIGIKSVNNKTEGRNSFFEIEFDQTFYNTGLTGGTGDNDFEDSGLKDFTEPMYMINIVQDGKSITDRNIDSYLDTHAYVKLESIIGEGDGSTVGPSFLLVDERWEDCCPALDALWPLSVQERFVHLQDTLGITRSWYNVTFLTPALITTITNAINTTGFYTTPGGENVYGIYRHTVSSDLREVTLVFDYPGFDVIESGDRILVKYDNRSPIRFFGGDTTTSDYSFAAIDREARGDDNPTEKNKQFILDIGFPFRSYFITPRHYVISNSNVSGTGEANIQNSNKVDNSKIFGRLAYIRQLVMNFIVDTRIATHYSHEGPGTSEKFFPATHYIMRPNKFNDSRFGNGADDVYDQNNIYGGYKDDYGDEFLLWEYGGFRFSSISNVDYSYEDELTSFSQPDVGFQEETNFCSGIIWSLSRAINQQDSPGLKTFLSLNTYAISDDQGAIKRAYDATSGKGENLYAIASNGICLLLTNKAVLSGIDASQIGLSASDQFIGEEYWLDKNIGMNDEMWRTWAEASIPITDPSTGATRRVEALFFANEDSVYRFSSNQIKDIAKPGYYSRLRTPLSLVREGYNTRVSGIYDTNHETYLLQLGWEVPVAGAPAQSLEESFVFSQQNAGFIGHYDYRFDGYLMSKNDLYGMRDGETYLLDRGYLINGSPIQFEADQAHSTAMRTFDKEFTFINVNSNDKPTRIEFFDPKFQLLCAMDPGIQGPRYLKEYDGYYQHIPRKDAIVSVGRDRIQDRLLIYKIIHNLESEFDLKDVTIDFKKIK